MSDEPRTTEIDQRFSSEGAEPRSWSDAHATLDAAEVYFLATVRPDRRPHVTPLIAVWVDDALHFCTGPDERKAKNIDANPRCAILTGCNKLGEGFDIVVEGAAERVQDEVTLRSIAESYVAKYGEDWRFEVRDGAFVGQPGNQAIVFRVVADKVFGFGKGEPFSQTRWRFAR